jgi:hypothetical protein
MNVNPALAGIAVLATGLFFAGAALQRRCPRTALLIGVVFALPGMLAIFYYTHLLDRWTWFYEARSLPLAQDVRLHRFLLEDCTAGGRRRRVKYT